MHGTGGPESGYARLYDTYTAFSVLIKSVSALQHGFNCIHRVVDILRTRLSQPFSKRSVHGRLTETGLTDTVITL